MSIIISTSIIISIILKARFLPKCQPNTYINYFRQLGEAAGLFDDALIVCNLFYNPPNQGRSNYVMGYV